MNHPPTTSANRRPRFVSRLTITAIVMSTTVLAFPGPAFADGTPATLPSLPTQDTSHVFKVSTGGDIQAAIDAAYDEGGGTVTLSSGTFDITTPLIPAAM